MASTLVSSVCELAGCGVRLQDRSGAARQQHMLAEATAPNVCHHARRRRPGQIERRVHTSRASASPTVGSGVVARSCGISSVRTESLTGVAAVSGRDDAGERQKWKREKKREECREQSHPGRGKGAPYHSPSSAPSYCFCSCLSPELSISQTHACNQPILMQACIPSHSDLSGKVFDTSPYLWGPASGSAYQEA